METQLSPTDVSFKSWVYPMVLVFGYMMIYIHTYDLDSKIVTVVSAGL